MNFQKFKVPESDQSPSAAEEDISSGPSAGPSSESNKPAKEMSARMGAKEASARPGAKESSEKPPGKESNSARSQPPPKSTTTPTFKVPADVRTSRADKDDDLPELKEKKKILMCLMQCDKRIHEYECSLLNIHDGKVRNWFGI